MNKFIVSALTIVSALSISIFAHPVKAEINNDEFNALQSNLKINAQNCKKNPKVKVNGKCPLGTITTSENTIAYKKGADGKYTIPVKLKMFDNPMAGKTSFINIVDFDKSTKFVWGYTSNKKLGTTMYKIYVGDKTTAWFYGC